jgi:ATP-dependent DNA helicase 2 subunit 1
LAVFEKEDLFKIRLAQQPQMTLLGFKSKEFLKDHYTVKPSLFMVADESNVFGSSVFLAKLIQRMEFKNVIGLCSLAMRKNSTLQLVALIPQLGTNEQPKLPTGFHVIPLPFADDLRDLQIPPLEHVDEKLIETFSSIIEPLVQPFDPRSIPNPSLSKQYAYLHAMAMGNEDIDFTDMTVPNYQKIGEASGPMIHSLNRMTQDIVPRVDVFKPVKASKRKAESLDAGDQAGFPEAEIRDAIANGSLNKFTVAQLTDIVKAKAGKVKSKRKADLVQQVVELFP